MAKLLMMSFLGMLMLVLSIQASVVPSPDQNSASDKTHVVEGVDDNTGGDAKDDNAIENELSDKEKDIGHHVDFPLDYMDDDELPLYMNEEDRILVGQTDEHVAFKLLKEKRALYKEGGKNLRRKRIYTVIGRAAFAVGRSLFKRFARTSITRSGSRLTRHYSGKGNYGDAVKDFNSLRPNNVRSFNGRISGHTGTVGNHRVTVRDGSSGNSKPTLEFRSHGGDVVRKFRYNKP